MFDCFSYTRRGVPSVIKRRITRTNPAGKLDIANYQEAVVRYKQTNNEMLTDKHPFEQDPLVGKDELIQKKNNHFFQNFVVDEIFSQCVNNQPLLFIYFILFCIRNHYFFLKQCFDFLNLFVTHVVCHCCAFIIWNSIYLQIAYIQLSEKFVCKWKI